MPCPRGSATAAVNPRPALEVLPPPPPPPILAGGPQHDAAPHRSAEGGVAPAEGGVAPAEEAVAPAEEDSGDDDFIDAEEAPDNLINIATPPRAAVFHPPSGVPIRDSNFTLPSALRHDHNLRPRPGGRTD